MPARRLKQEIIDQVNAKLRAYFELLKVLIAEDVEAAFAKAEARFKEREENRPVP